MPLPADASACYIVLHQRSVRRLCQAWQQHVLRTCRQRPPASCGQKRLLQFLLLHRLLFYKHCLRCQASLQVVTQTSNRLKHLGIQGFMLVRINISSGCIMLVDGCLLQSGPAQEHKWGEASRAYLTLQLPHTTFAQAQGYALLTPFDFSF